MLRNQQQIVMNFDYRKKFDNLNEILLTTARSDIPLKSIFDKSVNISK